MKEFIKRIHKDMVISMRLKEKSKIKVLKSLISDCQYSVKSKTQLTPIDILNKSVKERSDAIEEYKKANRLDLAENEELELLVLQKYIAKTKNDEGLREIVKKVIAENPGIATKTKGEDFDRLMKIFKEEIMAAQAARSPLLSPLPKIAKSEVKAVMGLK